MLPVKVKGWHGAIRRLRARPFRQAVQIVPLVRSPACVGRLYYALPDPVQRSWRKLKARTGIKVSLLDSKDDENHPERLAVLGELGPGRVLEVGCGYRKTDPDFFGVDLVPRGLPGRVGNVAGRISQADVAASGERLPMRDGSFDYVVARHNLEHYVNPFDALSEWRRVLRSGGRVVAVVPDEDGYAGRTLDLDPTHFHAFNKSFGEDLFTACGFRLLRATICMPHWSLLFVAERP